MRTRRRSRAFLWNRYFLSISSKISTSVGRFPDLSQRVLDAPDLALVAQTDEMSEQSMWSLFRLSKHNPPENFIIDTATAFELLRAEQKHRLKSVLSRWINCGLPVQTSWPSVIASIRSIAFSGFFDVRNSRYKKTKIVFKTHENYFLQLNLLTATIAVSGGDGKQTKQILYTMRRFYVRLYTRLPGAEADHV